MFCTTVTRNLNTVPIDQIVEQLRHFCGIFGAGETPEVAEAELVETKKQQVPKHHVEREVAAQDAAGHVIVIVF